MVKRSLSSKNSDNKPFVKLDNADELLKSEEVKKSEIFSFNVHASARGLARLGCHLASYGEPLEGDEKLLSKETVDKMHGDPQTAFDSVLGMYLCWETGPL